MVLQRLKRNVFNRLFNVAMGIFLGGSIKLHRLESVHNKAVVTHDQDLACNFSSPCVWFSEGSGKQQWNVADGTIDPLVWFTATASNIQPDGKYAYVQLIEGDADRLSSSILPCQKGSGLLTFDYWLSPTATVFGCALDATDNSQIHCSNPQPRDRGKASIKILGPIYIPFKLAIMTAGQGFVIVDQVTYVGEICTDGPSEGIKLVKPIIKSQKIIKPIPTTEAITIEEEEDNNVETPEIITFLEGSARAYEGIDRRESTFINSSEDLICDFSGDFGCRWGSELPWHRLKGEPHPDAWQIWSETSDLPVMPAGILTAVNASLNSDLILCQKSEGQILLKWWITANVKMRVCARRFPTEEEIYCTPFYDHSHETYPGPTIFAFPQQMIGPFVFYIETTWSSEDPGFLIIDDLAYFADICTLEPLIEIQTTTAKSTVGIITAAEVTTTPETTAFIITRTSPPTTPFVITRRTTTQEDLTTTTRRATTFTPPLPSEYILTDKRSCKKLNCDFEFDSCGYTVVDVGSAIWQRRRRGFGSPLSRLTDIRVSRTTGTYLGVHLRAEENFIAILESPSFSPTGIKIFEFRYYRAMHGVTLKMCLGTEYTVLTEDYISHSCQRIIPELNVANARKWNVARALLMPKYTKMFLVAEHTGAVRGHGALGLDNLRILNC